MSAAPSTDKREAILDAALDLFVERGFHGTAVPLIAEQAHVGAGTIYRYFESKEAIVNALFQEWKQRLGAAMLDGFPMSAPPRELFRTFWQRLMAFAVTHPKQVAFLELHHHAPYLDDTSRALEDRLLCLARTVLVQMQAVQAVKAVPPELLMAIVQGAFASLVRASWLGLLALTPELVDAAEGCCWEAIRR